MYLGRHFGDGLAPCTACAYPGRGFLTVRWSRTVDADGIMLSTNGGVLPRLEVKSYCILKRASVALRYHHPRSKTE